MNLPSRLNGRILFSTRPVIALLVFVCLAVPLSAQRGALTLPCNLSELVDQSETILRGRVDTAHVEPHPQYPGIHTVLVTLRVEESLKGALGDTFSLSSEMSRTVNASPSTAPFPRSSTLPPTTTASPSIRPSTSTLPQIATASPRTVPRTVIEHRTHTATGIVSPFSTTISRK